MKACAVRLHALSPTTLLEKLLTRDTWKGYM